MPNPNTAGGAPASLSRETRRVIEFAARMGSSDPGPADTIGVGPRQAGNLQEGFPWRVCRRDQHRLEPRLGHLAHERFRLQGRNIRNQQAVGSCCRGIPHEAGAGDNQIGVGQDADRYVLVPSPEVAR